MGITSIATTSGAQAALRAIGSHAPGIRITPDCIDYPEDDLGASAQVVRDAQAAGWTQSQDTNDCFRFATEIPDVGVARDLAGILRKYAQCRPQNLKRNLQCVEIAYPYSGGEAMAAAIVDSVRDCAGLGFKKIRMIPCTGELELEAEYFAGGLTLPFFVSAALVNHGKDAQRTALVRRVVRVIRETSAEYTMPVAYHLVLTDDRPTPAGVSRFLRELLAQREMQGFGGSRLGSALGFSGVAVMVGGLLAATCGISGIIAGSVLLAGLGICGAGTSIINFADRRSKSTLPPLSLRVWDAGDRLGGAEPAEPLLVAHIERVSGFWPGVHSREVPIREIAAIVPGAFHGART